MTDNQYDFKSLRTAEYSTLLTELVDTHTSIANLHTEIAFLRGEEINQVPHAKTHRITYEATRDALTEKKWLILKLLEHRED